MKKFLLSALLLVTGLAFAQPSNDNCANATVIPINTGVICTQPVTGTITGATASSPSVSTNCQGTADDDVWFTFTATSSLNALSLAGSPSNVNLRYYLYSGTCNALTFVACGSPSGNILPNNLMPDTTYFVRVFSVAATPQTVDLSLCLITAQPITVSTTLTAQQLVEDVLIGTPCMVISNITSSGGTNYNQPSSIGTFNKNNSSFPLDSGIILSTGSVAAAPGPNTTNQGNAPGWPGDPEMQTFIPGIISTDATKLEFDFVPMIDHISFNFIFASEEYGQYQCAFADAFAFILTDIETGVKTNLAVVPGTNVPISVVTIRDSQYYPACESVNAQYFANYYGTAPMVAPINFNGMTVPITAQSAVTPGKQYHIKLVIVNRTDHIFNSAVFLEAGSFNVGGLDSDFVQLTSSAGAVLCNGQGTTLSINGSNALTYSWRHGDDIIPGATSTTLNVTEAGTYTVKMAIPGNSGCFVEHTITLHSATAGTAPEIDDMWVYEENSDGQAPFSLAAQATAITSQTGYADMLVTFHLTQADAQANVNPLTSPYVNTVNPQVIFVRIQNPANSCYVISQFSIGAVDENYQTPPPTGPGTQGFVPGDTLADIEIDGENIQWYDNPGTSSGGFVPDTVDTPLPLTTLLVDGMTYYASQTKFGRESVQRLPVTIDSSMNTTDATFKNFAYRPNPVKDMLQLSNGQNIDKVDVYNVVGQMVKSSNYNSTNATVDLSSLNSGVYIVKVTSANAERTLKIVKQ